MKLAPILVGAGAAALAWYLYQMNRQPVATAAPPNSGASTTPTAMMLPNVSPSQTTGLVTVTPGLAGYLRDPAQAEAHNAIMEQNLEIMRRLGSPSQYQT